MLIFILAYLSPGFWNSTDTIMCCTSFVKSTLIQVPVSIPYSYLTVSPRTVKWLREYMHYFTYFRDIVHYIMYLVHLETLKYIGLFSISHFYASMKVSKFLTLEKLVEKGLPMYYSYFSKFGTNSHVLFILMYFRFRYISQIL